MVATSLLYGLHSIIAEEAMARTEHLPIYKASYDRCLCPERVVYGFTRHHKYTLGSNRNVV